MRANRALGVLRGFAAAFKISVGDFEVGVDPDASISSSGDLESDLMDLFLAVGEAAQAADTPVAILIDDVQYLANADLAALSGQAKSYAERLFDYPEVGPLDETASRMAIRPPVHIALPKLQRNSESRRPGQVPSGPLSLERE